MATTKTERASRSLRMLVMLGFIGLIWMLAPTAQAQWAFPQVPEVAWNCDRPAGGAQCLRDDALRQAVSGKTLVWRNPGFNVPGNGITSVTFGADGTAIFKIGKTEPTGSWKEEHRGPWSVDGATLRLPMRDTNFGGSSVNLMRFTETGDTVWVNGAARFGYTVITPGQFVPSANDDAFPAFNCGSDNRGLRCLSSDEIRVLLQSSEVTALYTHNTPGQSGVVTLSLYAANEQVNGRNQTNSSGSGRWTVSNDRLRLNFVRGWDPYEMAFVRLGGQVFVGFGANVWSVLTPLHITRK